MEEKNSQKMMYVRLTGYIIIVSFSLLMYLWLQADFAYFQPLEANSMIAGYIGFLFLALTLVVGAIPIWFPGKRSKYLLLLRRDFGIWGGTMIMLHVITVLIIYQNGPQFMFIHDDRSQGGWLGLFIHLYPDGEWRLKTSIQGIANYLGLIAFLFLLPMWLTSSDRAEQLLGKASWKRLHMSNLLLFVVAAFHAVIYVNGIKASPHSNQDILWIALIVLIVRLSTYVLVVIRRYRKR